MIAPHPCDAISDPRQSCVVSYAHAERPGSGTGSRSPSACRAR